MSQKVAYTTRDGKFTYQLDANLVDFIKSFGQEIQYKVSKLPPGQRRFAHADLRPRIVYDLYQSEDKQSRYLVYFSGHGWPDVYKLFT